MTVADIVRAFQPQNAREEMLQELCIALGGVADEQARLLEQHGVKGLSPASRARILVAARRLIEMLESPYGRAVVRNEIRKEIHADEPVFGDAEGPREDMIIE